MTVLFVGIFLLLTRIMRPLFPPRKKPRVAGGAATDGCVSSCLSPSSTISRRNGGRTSSRCPSLRGSSISRFTILPIRTRRGWRSSPSPFITSPPRSTLSPSSVPANAERRIKRLKTTFKRLFRRINIAFCADFPAVVFGETVCFPTLEKRGGLWYNALIKPRTWDNERSQMHRAHRA